MWRRLVMILLILGSIGASLVAVVKSEGLARFIGARLERLAGQALGATVRIESLELTLLPPAVIVHNVVVDPGEGATGLRAHLAYGRVRPHPWPSPAGALVIGEVEVHGLDVDDGLDPTAWLLPSEPSTQPAAPMRLPIDIRQLEVTDSRLTMRLGPHSVTFAGISARIRSATRGGRSLSLDVAQGAAHAPGVLPEGDTQFRAHLAGRLDGTFDRPRSLTLEEGSISVGALRLSGKGSIGLAAHPTVSGTTTLSGPLKALRTYVPSLPPLGGNAEIAVTWRGPINAPEASIRLAAEGLRVHGAVLGSVRADAVYNRQAIVVDAFRLTHPQGGSVTGSGRLGLTGHYDLEVAARLHDASLPVILEESGLPDAWIRLLASGDINAQGPLAPLGIVLDVDLTAHEFAVLDRSFHRKDAAVMLSIGNGAVRGRTTIGPRAALLEKVEVTANTSRLTVEGLLAYNPTEGLNLHTVATGFNLPDVGRIAGVPFTGIGAFAATIEGPYNHATVSATLETEGFGLLDYFLGDATATLIFTMPELIIDRLTLLRGTGVVTGGGRLYFDKPQLEAAGAFSVETLELSDVLTTLGLEPSAARHFKARLNGRVSIEGPLARPRGAVSLTAPDLTLDNVSFGKMSLEGGFAEHDNLAGAQLALTPRGGALRIDAAIKRDLRVRLGADVRDITLSLITPFLGQIPMTGRLTGSALLEGPLTALSGPVTTHFDDLVAWGLHLEKTELRGSAKNGVLNLKGTLVSGAVSGEATLELGRRLPFQAQVSCQSLEAGRLWPLGTDLSINVSGTLFAHGDLAEAKTLAAESELAQVAIRWRELTLRANAPVHIDYAQRRFFVRPLKLLTPSFTVAAQGEMPVDDALDLRLAIDGDISAITGLYPQLASARGPFDVHVLVGGTFAKPAFTGEGAIHNAALHFTQTEQVLDKIQTHLLFSGRGIVVQSGQASFGGGTLHFSGEALLQPSGSPELNVHGTMQNVTLRPVQDVEATLTGDLALQGPIDGLTLKGGLRVDSMRYTARLELDRLIPRRSAVPLRVPTAGQALKLNVKLHGPNNIIIQSNVLEAELQMDLTVTGSTDRVGLLGSVTPLWARARYRDNVFKVTRASIDFIDEYRVFTEFSLQAKTEACRMQAEVNIQGDSDNYAVVPYGQDEHGIVDPQDVLACLQFGLRLHDFAGNQKTPAAGLGDTLPGGLDALWTVSGLDEKVKKLLPINVDELRLTSGWSSLSQRNTARVLVGKELGESVALKYSRSLDEYNDQSLSVEYRLNDKTTMQGTWLSVRDVPVGDFGVDIRLHWEFQ